VRGKDQGGGNSKVAEATFNVREFDGKGDGEAEGERYGHARAQRASLQRMTWQSHIAEWEWKPRHLAFEARSRASVEGRMKARHHVADTEEADGGILHVRARRGRR
jgi:hypothetical protein